MDPSDAQALSDLDARIASAKDDYDTLVDRLTHVADKVKTNLNAPGEVHETSDALEQARKKLEALWDERDRLADEIRTKDPSAGDNWTNLSQSADLSAEVAKIEQDLQAAHDHRMQGGATQGTVGPGPGFKPAGDEDSATDLADAPSTPVPDIGLVVPPGGPFDVPYVTGGAPPAGDLPMIPPAPVAPQDFKIELTPMPLTLEAEQQQLEGHFEFLSEQLRQTYATNGHVSDGNTLSIAQEMDKVRGRLAAVKAEIEAKQDEALHLGPAPSLDHVAPTGVQPQESNFEVASAAFDEPPPAPPAGPNQGANKKIVALVVGAILLALVAAVVLAGGGGSESTSTSTPSVPAASDTGAGASSAVTPAAGPIRYQSNCQGECFMKVDPVTCDRTFHFDLTLLGDAATKFEGRTAILSTRGPGLQPTYEVPVQGGKVVVDAVATGVSYGGDPIRACGPPDGTASWTGLLTSVDGQPTSTPDPPK